MEEAAELNAQTLKRLKGDRAGLESKDVYEKAQFAAAAAKAELAAAEAELRLLVGPPPKADRPAGPPSAGMPSGPAVDKLEAVVLKPRKLAVDDWKTDVPDGFVALFKEAKLDGVSVRGAYGLRHSNGGSRSGPAVAQLVGELTFAGWVEYMLDEVNTPASQEGMRDEQRG
jgi:hypothetical protein